MLKLIAGGALLGLAVAVPVRAAEEVPLKEAEWSHHGIFGTYDRAAMQRGLQVYQNVCQGCHSLNFVAFRNLGDLGYSEEEVKAIAAQYTVTGETDESGEPAERPAISSDRFPPPYPNEKAAAAANGKAPPDLSLMVKARQGGENYLYSLLTGYEEPPADVEAPVGSYYNPYFPGHFIAMPTPLAPDAVTYEDGTTASVEQMAHDVVSFLAWTAEPKLEERKQLGLKVMLFLIVLTGLLFAYKRKIWSDVQH